MIDMIIEYYTDDTFLKADGFDEAIIGIDESSMRLIYSTTKCIEVLEASMSREEAVEFFNFNLTSSFMGDQTPIYCRDDF